MDHFEFYECNVEDQRAFVAVDLALHDDAPDASLPISVRVTVPMLAPRADGLNGAEERPALDAIEDRLSEAFAAEGAVYVGRGTWGGARRHYFYAGSEGCVRPALERVRAVVTDRRLEAGWFEDPGWRQYLEFLYPNDLAWAYIKDRRVVDALHAEGDDGQVERKIDHWAYFSRAEDREAFAARIVDDGLQVDGRSDDGRSDHPFALYFSHRGAPARVHGVTSRLHVLASEFGGDYDGWECEVVGSGGRPSA